MDCSFAALRPREYVAHKFSAPPHLDGNLREAAWEHVPWTSDFVDISTPTLPWLHTRAKLAWDDRFLYVGAELEDPQLWATLRRHDEVIFHDNDFEIFVDANATTHGYKEFEMNAYNATWDLMLSRPYGDGGGEISCRVSPAPCFDMQPPLASAVQLNGSLNQPAGPPDGGWSVEVALPLDGLMAHNAGADQRPRDGVFWRINFSRVQWALKVDQATGRYVKAPACQSCAQPGSAHEDNWVWSPQGEVAMHEPETWAIVQFAEGGAAAAASRPAYDEWPARALARALYRAQRSHRAQAAAAAVRLHTRGAGFATPPPPYTADLAALDRLAEPPGVLAACASAATRVDLAAGGESYTASVGSVVGPRSTVVQVNDQRFTTVTRRAGRGAELTALDELVLT